MSTITPTFRTVQQLLQNQSFTIDDYQREYKWEREHIVELISDFREKFQSCYQHGDLTKQVSKYEDYFLGSIIVSKRAGKNYLIDGQQRVTSLTLLLIYLLHAAKDQSLPVESSIPSLIYSDSFGEPCFNLDIPERLPVIEALFYKKPFDPTGKDESTQNMFSRYQDIESEDLVEGLGEALPHFIYWLLTKVGLIEISTDNDNYAYAIFETMNDRGMPLSPVDMLKAYLLAPIESTGKRHAANQIWKQWVFDLINWGDWQDTERDSHFIKAWLRAQYAETIRERKAGSTDKDWELVGNNFHRWVRDSHARFEWGSEEQNLELINKEIPFFINAYKVILDASFTFTPGLESVFYNAHNEVTWQNTVLLSPLCPTDDRETVRKKLNMTAAYLDIWIMRRATNYIRVGYSSTSYAMYLLCKEIRRKSLQELAEILSSRLAADDVTFDGNGNGRYGIKDLRLNQFTRRYIYHMLARITSYVEASSGKPNLFDKYVDRTGKNACDIEHIWPDDYTVYQQAFSSQDEFQAWRNHIGGLLLLPADVNRSYQDKPYEDKVPYYATQNLYAASLSDVTYKHQPQFEAFRKTFQAPGQFNHYAYFGKNEQVARRELVQALVERIWAPSRILEAAK